MFQVKMPLRCVYFLPFCHILYDRKLNICTISLLLVERNKQHVDATLGSRGLTKGETT